MAIKEMCQTLKKKVSSKYFIYFLYQYHFCVMLVTESGQLPLGHSLISSVIQPMGKRELQVGVSPRSQWEGQAVREGDASEAWRRARETTGSGRRSVWRGGLEVPKALVWSLEPEMILWRMESC